MEKACCKFCTCTQTWPDKIWQKNMLPHNSHICLCTCTKFATCLLHDIISDLWNLCLSMLIRSCPSGRTKFLLTIYLWCMCSGITPVALVILCHTEFSPMSQGWSCPIDFCLCVCVCVCVCVCGKKTMLPHNSHICLCTCTKFATCLRHYIISDLWNLCLSMLIRSCPIDRTKFEIPRPRSVGSPRRGLLVSIW